MELSVDLKKEIVFASSDPDVSHQISRLEKQNRLRKITDLPGVTIYMLKGPAADEKDMIYGKMFIASEYRWMLENMQASRKREEEAKTLPIALIERKLESVLVAGGEEQLNQYRDTLRTTAERLGMVAEFAKINVLISALLNTHSSQVLTTPGVKAAAAGLPYDEKRVALFETVAWRVS